MRTWPSRVGWKFYCFKSYCYGWTFLSCTEIYCCLFCGVWRVNDWRSTLLVSSLQNFKKIPLKYLLKIKRMQTFTFFFLLFLNKCSWYVSKKFHIWCLFTSEGSKEVVQIDKKSDQTGRGGGWKDKHGIWQTASRSKINVSKCDRRDLKWKK